MSIASEIEEIRDGRDLVTAEEVVDWARAHKDSALYNAPQFQGWDEKKAAREHWLAVARRLIAIHVVYEDTGMRKTVSLSIDRSRKGGGYRSVDDVLADRSLYEIMMEDALTDLKRLEIKYEHIKALHPVWREAAKVRRKYERKGGKRKEERAKA